MEALKTCECLKDIFVEWLNLERFFLDFAMIDKKFLQTLQNIETLQKH